MLRQKQGLFRLTKKISIVPFSLAIGNVEFMQDCFPKHTRMETARMKEDKEKREKIDKK